MQKWVVLLFQFHNGTINTYSSKHKKTVNVYSFNSTTVQLIRLGKLTGSTPLKFQFHNGTINTYRHII